MRRTLPEPRPDSFDLTTVLSALSHPARRHLLASLRWAPELTDCAAINLPEKLGLGAPTVSHHSRVLREAGLVRTVVEGRAHWMSLRKDDVDAVFPGLLDAVLEAGQGEASREPGPPSGS